MNKDFSVIVPVYNSVDSLEELFIRLKDFFEGIGKSYEVIFVEDGGTDGSWGLLKKMKKAHPLLIKAIKLDRNFGQHNATLCGFEFAIGKQIVTIDDDLQNPPEEIAKLIETAEKQHNAVTYGIYAKKQHSFARNVMSKSVKTSSKYFHHGSKNGSSFRLMDRKIVDKILNHRINFVFIDEIISWYTDNIGFVYVKHVKRKHHRSGYSSIGLFKLAANLTYFYSNIPLKIMVYSGFTISIISFLIAVKFIIQKLYYNVPLGYTSVIVTILFSTSIIVFSLGIIGGYLSRIQTIQNNKPSYHIDKILD
ncbi:MAG: glycosyltransferase family 2 protein [Bacteroidales bacterium]|jgi:undecaprenyl-phosphate 4-deoxy-4-formamido-L-arabinose transferase